MILGLIAAAVLARDGSAPRIVAKPRPPASVPSTLASLNVVDYDLAKTLRLLSQQTKVNMVLLSDPGTKLTLNLTNVRLSDLVRHICALTGLSFLNVNGTYAFATEEQLKKGYPAEWAAANPPPPPKPQAERSMRVYRTSYLNADSLANSLRELFAKQDVVVSSGPEVGDPWLPTGNAQEVTGIKQAPPQNATNVRTTYGDDVKKDLYNRSRTVLISGDSALVERALAAATQLDVPRKQVVIDVSVLETSDDLARELGLSWTFGRFSLVENSGDQGVRPIGVGGVNRSPLSAGADIRANELRTKSRVLASPSVAVLDGENAFVLIGSRIKYSVLKQPATQFSPAVYDVNEDRVGIYLQVAAQIAADGTITMDLYPQVSTVTGYINVNGSNLPQISTREARTVLRIASGQTIAMGGLFQDQDVNQIEKVPLLGDIPVIGEFFKRRKRTKASTQLVITITPRVVEVPAPR